MAQIDILRDVLDYSLRKFNHVIIGSHIYYIFNNERYAIGKLHKSANRNEFDGVSIIYISKLFGRIDECEILFKDVFVDAKRASINVNITSDEYEWYESLLPTNRDLNRLAMHVEKYINIIGDFGENLYDYSSAMILATEAAMLGAGVQNENKQLPMTEAYPSLEELTEAEAEDEPEFIDEEFLVDPIEDLELEEERTTAIDVDDFVEEPIEEFSEEEVAEPLEESEEIPSPVPEPEEKTAKRGFFNFFKGKDRDFREEKKAVQVEEEPVSKSALVTYQIGEENDRIAAYLYEVRKGFYRLEIIGKGKMKNFTLVPWEKYGEKIETVTFSDGITHIGNNAFKSFSLLKQVDIPSSVESIGKSAFEFCGLLEKVSLPEGLKEIDEFAFAGTENLKEVFLPRSLERIKDYGFDIHESLSIYYRENQYIKLGDGLSLEDFQYKEEAAFHVMEE